jgi:hypothetical protein
MGSRVHRSQCDNSDRKLGHEHPIPVSSQDIAQDTGQTGNHLFQFSLRSLYTGDAGRIADLIHTGHGPER